MSKKQEILKNKFIEISNYKKDPLDKNDKSISDDTLAVAYAIAKNIPERYYINIGLFTIGDGDVIISLEIKEDYTLQLQIYNENKIFIRELKSHKLHIDKNVYNIDNIMNLIKNKIYIQDLKISYEFYMGESTSDINSITNKTKEILNSDYCVIIDDVYKTIKIVKNDRNESYRAHQTTEEYINIHQPLKPKKYISRYSKDNISVPQYA